MKSGNISCVAGIRISFATAIAVVGIMIGCDDPTTASHPATRPAAAVATSQPAESPAVVAYPVRPPSTLFIDGRDVSFPAAKLAVISHENGGITLRLCSDDPPTAIDPGYIGNSYLFDMQLAIDHLAELPAARWDRKASDPDDSVSGIFLHGYRNPLHPADMHVTFQKIDGDLLTFINGTFLRDDSHNLGAPPTQVQVSGCLRTSLPTE